MLREQISEVKTDLSKQIDIMGAKLDRVVENHEARIRTLEAPISLDKARTIAGRWLGVGKYALIGCIAVKVLFPDSATVFFKHLLFQN